MHQVSPKRPGGRRLAVWVSLGLLFGVMMEMASSAVAAEEPVFPPEVVNRVAAELSSRRFDPANEGVRGFGDVFRNAAGAVPFIISAEGVGSAVVIHVADAVAWVVTNRHVVTPAFVDKDGTQVVGILFYDLRFARNVLDPDRSVMCLTGRDRTPWRDVLRQVLRLGKVARVDAGRDLALVEVPSPPPGVRLILPGTLAAVSPGDEVAVIGHPLGFVWSLTTGIISGVRSGRIASSPDAPAVTVIQTQTPINPGNSGGPLLSAAGRLLGIMFGSREVPVRMEAGSSPVGVPSQGINLAVGIDEVSDFVTRPAR